MLPIEFILFTSTEIQIRISSLNDSKLISCFIQRIDRIKSNLTIHTEIDHRTKFGSLGFNHLNRCTESSETIVFHRVCIRFRCTCTENILSQINRCLTTRSCLTLAQIHHSLRRRLIRIDINLRLNVVNRKDANIVFAHLIQAFVIELRNLLSFTVLCHGAFQFSGILLVRIESSQAIQDDNSGSIHPNRITMTIQLIIQCILAIITEFFFHCTDVFHNLHDIFNGNCRFIQNQSGIICICSSHLKKTIVDSSMLNINVHQNTIFKRRNDIPPNLLSECRFTCTGCTNKGRERSANNTEIFITMHRSIRKNSVICKSIHIIQHSKSSRICSHCSVGFKDTSFIFFSQTINQRKLSFSSFNFSAVLIAQDNGIFSCHEKSTFH